MAICGLNINISSLQGEITTQISGFLDLESSLTTPSGAASYLSSLEGGLATLKSKVDTLVPDIPFSTSGLTSLRDQLTAYVSVPSVSGLADIASKFGGLTSLTGFADINLSDLASSALSLGASFDPCSLAGDLKIPNIVADASGALQALPSIQPDIGATFAAAKIALEDQTITDKIAEVVQDNNTKIESILTPNELDLILSDNISTAVTGMGDVIKKLPSGEEVVETKAAFVTEVVKERTPILTETIETYTPSKDYFITASGSKRYYAKIRYQSPEIRAARKAALKVYKAETGLTGITLLRAFKKKYPLGTTEF